MFFSFFFFFFCEPAVDKQYFMSIQKSLYNSAVNKQIAARLYFQKFSGLRFYLSGNRGASRRVYKKVYSSKLEKLYASPRFPDDPDEYSHTNDFHSPHNG